MSHRVRAASIDEISEDHGLEVVLEGKIIGLFRVEGEIVALDGICPHAGGPLGQGACLDGIVTCPWHGWQFDTRTGQHCLTPQIRQTPYEVEVVDQEIFVIFSDT
ncbi:MAG: Rieske (2Fe-2S) protein [Planctomycetaceae bacterium]|jgi:nitrite reductase (NADH) small subunit|nr:Rieske (2Fe-2S) protein [bacterium]MDC0274042.1 Rieske (2Fe-2S) protein [Planctomycetaceae bacterium]MDG2390899.1 Rieske (2Fe-2S) protein [Planctomycetaceae bacterium]